MLGEKGVKLVGRRFLDMGFPWHPTNAPLDAGIDGFIELRDPSTGEASNSWIAVQSKARTYLEKESEQTFEFTCTARDLEYWRRGNMPVLLVVSRPDTDEAWWVAVKEYFRDSATHNSRRIVFDKAGNRLGPDARLPLLSLAQAAGAGTYFRPSANELFRRAARDRGCWPRHVPADHGGCVLGRRSSSTFSLVRSLGGILWPR